MGLERVRERVLWLMAAGVVLASPALAAEPPRVAIIGVRNGILVAEPVVIDARFSGMEKLWLEPLGAKARHLRLLIDRGRGFELYAPLRFVAEDHDGPLVPEGGRHRMEFVLIWDKSLDDWAFPRAGTFRIVLEYQDAVVGTLRSNIVSLSVSDPDGPEGVVLGRLRPLRDALVSRALPMRLGELEPLVREFPDSAYLQVARLSDISSRFADAVQGCEGPLSCPTEKDEIERRSEDLLRALLPDAESLASVKGPFQPDARLIQARILGGIGQRTAQQSLLERIVSEDGQRLAADRAKLWMVSPQ